MRCLRPAVRKPVVHCSDERRRQGTHRFHSFEFLDKNTAYQATILRDLAEKMTDGAWKPGKSLPEMPFPSPCASKAEVSSAWFPPERGILPLKNGILPQAGKKPPLLPSSKAGGGKPCSSAATPPVPEKPGKKVTKLNPPRAARPHPAPWCSTPEASAPPER